MQVPPYLLGLLKFYGFDDDPSDAVRDIAEVYASGFDEQAVAMLTGHPIEVVRVVLSVLSEYRDGDDPGAGVTCPLLVPPDPPRSCSDRKERPLVGAGL